MALQDHAIVPTGQFRVPLLGIPPHAALQECDLCHVEHSLSDVEIVFGETDTAATAQILCSRCRADGAEVGRLRPVKAGVQEPPLSP